MDTWSCRYPGWWEGWLHSESSPAQELRMHTVLRPAIQKYIKQHWQAEWDEFPNNKLHRITPFVDGLLRPHLEYRQDQVVLTRCCIGHSRLTHVFLLKGEPQPECVSCQCLLTLEHILLECIEFALHQQHFYNAPNLRVLFRTVKAD